MPVRIVVDSTCDLTQDIIKKYDMKVVPLKVTLAGQDYLDGITIKIEDVYNAMRLGKQPLTSQANPMQFRECFAEIAEKGEQCICFIISSKLSGTYQSALLGAEEIKEKYSDFKMAVIDSKGGSTATGLMALQAAKMAEEGYDFDTIVNQAKFQCDHIEHIFTINDLSWLQKGGRISRSQALIGEMLDIKPILDINDGEIMLLKKVRGQKKAIKTVLDIMAERIGDFREQIIGISHADDLQLALYIKKLIEEKLGCKKFMINLIGSALGTHIGIGGVGVFFLNERPGIYIEK